MGPSQPAFHNRCGLAICNTLMLFCVLPREPQKNFKVSTFQNFFPKVTVARATIFMDPLHKPLVSARGGTSTCPLIPWTSIGTSPFHDAQMSI